MSTRLLVRQHDVRLRLLLLGVTLLSLLLAAPARAAEPTILKARGPIVTLDEEWIAVKGADETLRCRIPDRLVEKAERLALADRVSIVCSKRGRRSPELQAVAREPKQEKADRAQTIAGKVKAVSVDAIAVADGDRVVRCNVPEPKADELEGVAVGDRVKISCKGGDLVQLARLDARPAAVAVDIAGLVSAVSASSITVASTDKSRSLTCSVPAKLADDVHALAVGDPVKLLCKRSADGTQLAAVARLSEKRAEPAVKEWSLAGLISSLSGDRVVVTGEERSLSCSIPAGLREKLAGLAVGARVKLLCRGAELGSAAVAAITRL